MENMILLLIRENSLIFLHVFVLFCYFYFGSFCSDVRLNKTTRKVVSIFFYHIVHIDFDVRGVYVKSIPTCQNLDQKHVRFALSLKKIQTSEAVLSLCTKLGYISTIHKQSSNRCNGDTLVFQGLGNSVFQRLLKNILLQFFRISKDYSLLIFRSRAITGYHLLTLLMTLRKKIVRKDV